MSAETQGQRRERERRENRLLKFCLVFILVMLGLLAFQSARAADITDGGFAKCADEQGGCPAGAGERQARYGAGEQWVQQAVAAEPFTCNTYLFGSDPAPGVAKACYIASGSPADPDAAPSINWSNSSHQMQALMVAACVFALLMGYRSGDKL